MTSNTARSRRTDGPLRIDKGAGPQGRRTRPAVAPRGLLVLCLALAAAGVPAVALAEDCLVTAHSTVRLGAAASGVLAEVLVDRGDFVTKGDLLASLESSAQQAQLRIAEMRAENGVGVATAESELLTARAQADRLLNLRARDLVPEDEAEQAVLAAETAALRLEQARFDQALAVVEAEAAAAALERTRVRAPFDGVVTERLLAPGEVYSDAPILSLARVDPLHVETYRPLGERALIRVGMPVLVRMEDGQQTDGTVTVIDPVLDAATGTFGLRIEVANPEARFLAGQRCDVIFR